MIEETFPLSCGVDNERDFLLQSRGIAAGWIGHYPKETPDELLALGERIGFLAQDVESVLPEHAREAALTLVR